MKTPLTAPLHFTPAYKQPLWGGNKIYDYKGLPAPAQGIGETWEISGMPGGPSVVDRGPLRGKTLAEVTAEYGAGLLGQKVFDRFGTHFPLLVKLIDAGDDLSIQVHPDDDYARKHHDGSLGKTEMWYLLDCTPEATIRAGWEKETNPTELRRIVQTDEVLSFLKLHRPRHGDLFYLPAGKVHSIGAGCLILEIQEASDITYRLFDFNRTDAHGMKRELHIDPASEVINYAVDTEGAKNFATPEPNKLVTMVVSPYFRTSVLSLTDESFHLDLGSRDSFTFYFVEEGEVAFEGQGGWSEKVRKGDFLLLPAPIKETDIKLHSSSAKLIECFVP